TSRSPYSTRRHGLPIKLTNDYEPHFARHPGAVPGEARAKAHNDASARPTSGRPAALPATRWQSAPGVGYARSEDTHHSNPSRRTRSFSGSSLRDQRPAPRIGFRGNGPRAAPSANEPSA